MIKLISWILTFSILFTSVAPSYAQALERSGKEEAAMQAIDNAFKNYTLNGQRFNFLHLKKAAEIVSDELLLASLYGQLGLSEEGFKKLVAQKGSAQNAVYDILLEMERKELEAENEEYRRAEALLKSRYGDLMEELSSTAEYRSLVYGDLLRYVNDEVFELTQGDDSNLFKLDIGDRISAGFYKQVALELYLNKYWSGALEGNTYVGIDIIDSIKGLDYEIAEAIAEVGITERGLAKAEKYLKAMVMYPGVCESVDKKEDYRHKSQEGRCLAATKAMEGLVVLSRQHGEGVTKRTKKLILDFILNKHRKEAAIGAVFHGMLMLLALDAKEEIQRFLSEAHRSAGGQFLDGISYISLEGIASAVQEAGTEGNYLDGYTARYSYLDEEVEDILGYSAGTCQS